jgi:cytochrome P450
MTTTNVLACALWLLSCNPEAEAGVEHEVSRIPVTELEQSRLSLTRATVLETLRLYPPVWAMGRRAVEDVTLKGQVFPAGTFFMICSWTLHRDPRHFPDPDEFKPERWDGNLEDSLPRGSYIPFSLGPRSCIGERFALMEAVLVISRLLQTWRFTRVEANDDFGWLAHIIYWPSRGIRMRAERRPSTELA